MSNQVYANYAEALFSLIDKNSALEYKSCLNEIVNFLLQNKDIFKFICVYGIDKKRANNVISELAKSYDLEYLENFLLLLSKRHRMSHLSEICQEFSHLVNDYCNIKEGYVYSSIKLTEEQKKSIEKVLSKKLGSEVELHNQIDSSLLGGIKVSIDGKVYDNSLKSSIEKLSKTLLGGNGI